MKFKQMTRFVKLYSLLVTAFVASMAVANAQADKKYIRKGNREYNKDNYAESEILYRKAIDKNKNSHAAIFNAGDALYKQKKYEEAGKKFLDNINLGTTEKNQKSSAYYNLGNSLLMDNKIQESIEAYKNSLKLNPDNMEAKYNLAYAQDLLQKQQKQNQDKDRDQSNNEKDKQQEEKNQNQNQEQQREQSQNNQTNEPAMNEQQQNLSQEDAERILNALENDEKKVQEKVKLEKAAKARVRSMKNW